MINELQELKGKTKLKFYKDISKYYDEMNIRNFNIEQDPFNENAEGISDIYHEVLLLMKFFQTKPQLKNLNINYYNLYYTVIRNKDIKETVKNKNEKIGNDYINFNDIITPNHYIGIRPRETILK